MKNIYDRRAAADVENLRRHKKKGTKKPMDKLHRGSVRAWQHVAARNGSAEA